MNLHITEKKANERFSTISMYQELLDRVIQLETNKPPETTQVTGVSISEKNKTVTIGDVFDLTATISPSDATNKGLNWSSSNTDVASVNNGHVVSVSQGNSTISVSTKDGGFVDTCGLVVKPVVVNDGNLDVIIVFGQSNAVCFSGSNGAPLAIPTPTGCFEYRPSLNNIQPFSNPVGEGVSEAGAAMGYTTGGTWFSSMLKEYKEKVGKNVVVIPCGNPGVSSNTYYAGAANFNMMLEKWNSFKVWIESQSEHTLGRVITVWHQGESGTGDGTAIKDSFHKVFSDASEAIPEIDQVFFCKIAQNDACDPQTTKTYNDSMTELNNEKPWVLIADCMKYYWLNQFADVHHYDQHADNDLGKIISANIVSYYAMGKVKPDIKPFDEKGKHNFAEFTGITLTENNLCSFNDSLNSSKKWAVGSSLYGSYAKINEIGLRSKQTSFELSFDIKLGDKENTAVRLAPVLSSGAGSYLSVSSNSVVINDGTNSVTLNHSNNPIIIRGGNVTKDTTEFKFKIKKNIEKLELYVNGSKVSEADLPVFFDAKFDTLFKKGSSTYLEGIISELSYIADNTIPEEPEVPFSYTDSIFNSTIAKTGSIANGKFIIKADDDVNDLVKLDKTISLDIRQNWMLDVTLNMSKYGNGNYLTILGNEEGNPIQGIEALQISDTEIRFYSNEDMSIPHKLNSNIVLNSDVNIKLSSQEEGLFIKINGSEVIDLKKPVILADRPSGILGNYDTLAQCFNNGDNMAHEGEIKTFRICTETLIVPEPENPGEPPEDFVYSDDVFGTVLTSPTSVVDGVLKISAVMPEPVNFLDKPLALDFSTPFELTFKFKCLASGLGDCFAFLGVKTGADINALMLYNGGGKKGVRFYSGNRNSPEKIFPYDYSYTNELQTFILSSDGSGTLKMKLDDSDIMDFQNASEELDGIIGTYEVLAQSYFSGGTMGHVGEVYEATVSSELTLF